MTAYGHSAGESIECLSIAIELKKEETVDQYGNIVYKVGFKIGGGIDQDPSCAPFKYPDQGIYITHIEENSPAARAGLKKHDKILQVNGLDFTLLTHERAVKYIKKYAVLDMLVARADLPPLQMTLSPSHCLYSPMYSFHYFLPAQVHFFPTAGAPAESVSLSS